MIPLCQQVHAAPGPCTTGPAPPRRAGKTRLQHFAGDGRFPSGDGSGPFPLAESQSRIVASMVSRRAGPVRSHLARGTGVHRMRTVPAQGRDAAQERAGLTWVLCGLVGVSSGFKTAKAVGQSPIL
jgi:hypothetical protein